MSRALNLAVLSLSLVFSFSSIAATNDCLGSAGRLSVKGYAEVKVVPDVVNLNFTVSDTKKKSADAYKSVETRVATFANALSEFDKEKSLEIISENISVFPQYTYKENKSVFAGYKASRSVTVKTSDFAKISKITELAMQSGVDIVDSFNYEIKDPKALQLKADKLAILDAKDKAKLLSEGFDTKIVKTCSLKFANEGVRPVMRMMSANIDLASESAPYSPQDQTISSTVMAEFLIE
ncbi:MAG: SIMPL domain-containing protein [Succinatimonas sp.]|nr:SIMPL domain-containing protein [Succinatimonas sp.]